MNGKIDLVRKLTSRKFWMAIANFVGMLIVALGGTESQAAQVTALIIAGATVIAYIIGEGLVDAANKVPEGELIELEGVTDEKDM
jgi:hypothetical protein